MHFGRRVLRHCHSHDLLFLFAVLNHLDMEDPGSELLGGLNRELFQSLVTGMLQ